MHALVATLFVLYRKLNLYFVDGLTFIEYFCAFSNGIVGEVFLQNQILATDIQVVFVLDNFNVHLHVLVTAVSNTQLQAVAALSNQTPYFSSSINQSVVLATSPTASSIHLKTPPLTAVVWRVQTDGVDITALFRVSKDMDLVAGTVSAFSEIAKITLPAGAVVSVSQENFISAMICKNK